MYSLSARAHCTTQLEGEVDRRWSAEGGVARQTLNAWAQSRVQAHEGRGPVSHSTVHTDEQEIVWLARAHRRGALATQSQR